MKFLVISFAPVLKKGNHYQSYAPYVNEMDIWFSHVDEIGFCSPDYYDDDSLLLKPYARNDFKLFPVKSFTISGAKNSLITFLKLPRITFQMYKAMKWADHIHLRCPGNMALIALFLQIFFPKKPKTAKYAGNWDWNSKQPWSYRLQQKMLQNTFLTKNMSVLVYGNWPGATKNIKPFFTASYVNADKIETPIRSLHADPLQLIFVGGLSEGKQPLLSIKVCEAMLKMRPTVLHLYGDGVLKTSLRAYIEENHLTEHVFIHGNQTAEVVKKAMQQSHFLIFISKSEGWPKVVAEAMFWGCLPITTAVSCVPEMLGNGQRGSLVNADVNSVLHALQTYLDKPKTYAEKAAAAMTWSREFTLERFEEEIKVLLDKQSEA